MAKIDGKCANCGSIIRIDNKSEKSRCPFCWAETDNTLAQNLFEDDSNHSYKNENYTQPTDDERLNLIRGGNSVNHVSSKRTSTQVQPKKKKDNGPSAVEKVKAMNKAIVRVPRVPLKKWLIVFLIPAVLLILFLAISLPTYFSRINKRAELLELLKNNKSFNISDSSHFSIDGLSNELLLFVSDEDPGATLSEKMAKEYQLMHDNVYGNEAGTGKVRVQILSSNKSYEFVIKGENITANELKDSEPIKIQENESAPAEAEASKEEIASSEAEVNSSSITTSTSSDN